MYSRTDPLQILTIVLLMTIPVMFFFWTSGDSVTINIERPYLDQYESCQAELVDIEYKLDVCSDFRPNYDEQGVNVEMFFGIFAGAWVGGIFVWFVMDEKQKKKREEKRKAKKEIKK